MSTRASTPATTLRGRWLVIARAAWGVIATLALGLFIASIPAYVLTLGKTAWFGAPVEAPAGVVFVLDLLGALASITAALVCLTLAFVLFWRKSVDWMVMFISSYLLAYGTVMAGRDSDGWSLGESGSLLPRVALISNRRNSTPVLNDTNGCALRSLSRGEICSRWTRWLLVLSIPLTVASLYLPFSYSWAILSLLVLSAFYAQIYRYRYVSSSPERQQTKWVVFGILLWLLLMGILFVPYSIEINRPPGSPLPWWSVAGSTGWWLTLTIVPIALSVAVLRYRLYEIDLIINRTLVYGGLTAMLVGVYVGTIVVLQGMLRALTGHESQLAIVASTLVVAALFNPLRRRIQAFIDRRFYRRKYDAAKTLEAFSAKLRDETDLNALSDDLVGVVRETMQPTHVSLWLRPDASSKREQAN